MSFTTTTLKYFIAFPVIIKKMSTFVKHNVILATPKKIQPTCIIFKKVTENQIYSFVLAL